MPDQNPSDKQQTHEKADASNPAHIAAPMPGLIARVSVIVGPQVSRGDSLLTMEAMKMQKVTNGERDSSAKQILVTVRTQVEAKDVIREVAQVRHATIRPPGKPRF